MPGHIFQRVGRYTDAVKANQLAIVADEDYITQCRAQGLYPLGYYPHNIHFLWFAATMAGQSELAISSARKTASSIPVAAVKEMPILQSFMFVEDYRARALWQMGRNPGVAGIALRISVHARRSSLCPRHGVHPQERFRQRAARACGD